MVNKNIFITGSSGFIGLNLIKYLSHFYTFSRFKRGDIITLDHDIFLHLAGKAHDFKNSISFNEYFIANTDLTIKVYEAFLASNAKIFITLSSVKAVADEVKGILLEDILPNPVTYYGKSKLLAEQFIFSKPIPEGKRVYILRPCMVHGPGNKGNLNILYKFVSKGIPWPLGSFANSRSYLSIENLCFIIHELLEIEDIPSGVYNVADDVPLSTNQLIHMIADSKGIKAKIWNLSMTLIKRLSFVGDFLNLPLNSERLQKLTESYIVSNSKIKAAIGKPLPVSSKDGLMRTFQSFVNNA